MSLKPFDIRCFPVAKKDGNAGFELTLLFSNISPQIQYNWVPSLLYFLSTKLSISSRFD